ncbi:MAG: glycosyltransferase family 4 protein [Nitrospirae bacterium]|nr:glycosyltransferase family 4 protein [Nitrospirota bacterium]
MDQAPNDKKIAYILGNYPGKIETFVLNEMKELERIGVGVYVCPIHHIPVNGKGKVEFNPIYAEPFNLPGIILSHLSFMLARPVPYLRCLLINRSYGGKLVFWKSAYFARAIKKLGIQHIHAHFGWTAADSARVVSRLIGVPFSLSLHAADIYYLPDKLGRKLKEAKFVLTCVKNNKEYIRRTFGDSLADKVDVVYHGVDLETFSPRSVALGRAVDVLSIGNLVEKKGHCYLIEACGILKRKGISLRCLIIGEGPEKERLINIINELGLGGMVEIQPRRPQNELPQVYAGSKIFVLPSFITDKGDRDGIPNVLAEAMAMGLPVVTSDVPNISELIEHDKDGILVRQKDPEALAEAIERLLNDGKKRGAIGKMAREKVENEFDARKHIKRVAEVFLQHQTSN